MGRPARWFDLGGLLPYDDGAGDYTWTQGTCINNSGLVGGICWPADGTKPHPLIWTAPNTYTDVLPKIIAKFGTFNLGTWFFGVNGISSNYAVMGYADVVRQQACVYNLTTGTLTNEPGFAGTTYVRGLAVNDTGTVVGVSSNGTAQHAFADIGGTVYDCGALNSTAQVNASTAVAINASNVVVGNAATTAFYGSNVWICADFHATIWDSCDGLRDLNTLYAGIVPTGWTLQYATGINNAGWICGYGTDWCCATEGFVLPPILPGDANLDGKVDINDLTIVLTNYNQSTGMTLGHGRLQRRRQGGHQRPDHRTDQLRPEPWIVRHRHGRRAGAGQLAAGGVGTGQSTGLCPTETTSLTVR